MVKASFFVYTKGGGKYNSGMVQLGGTVSVGEISLLLLLLSRRCDVIPARFWRESSPYQRELADTCGAVLP
jgi:hypothetical protein